MATITHAVKLVASAKDAIAEIQKYEDRIVATAQTVDKYAASLGGGKVLANANNWVAAVDKVGGATKLTESEQRRLNATLNEAIAKYRALGQQAPTDMIRLAKATEGANQSVGLMAGAIAKIGPMLAASFSVGAVVAFGRNLIRTAEDTTRLSLTLGDSAEAVQRLTYLADQTNVPFEQMQVGIAQIQKRLAGGEGSASALGAVKALGLSLSDLKAMSPEQQFYAIGEAVNRIPDPLQRSYTAQLLFGESGAKLLPAMSANMRQIANDAAVMSNTTVAGMKAISDAITEATNRLTVGLVNGIVTATYSFAAFFAKFAPEKDQAAILAMIMAIEQGIKKTGTSAAIAVPDIKAMTDAETKAAAAAKQAAADLQDFWSAVDRADTAMRIATSAERRTEMEAFWKSVRDKAKEAADELRAFILGARELPSAMATLPTVTSSIAAAGEETVSWTDKALNAGRVIDSILSNISGKVAETLTLISRTVSSVIQSLAKGDVVGAIASAAAGIVGVFGKFWGTITKAEGRKVNDLRDQFIAAAGGLAELNARAHDAGMTLDALLRASTVKDYEAAVNALNAAFERQNALIEERKRLEAEAAGIQDQIAALQQQLVPSYQDLVAVAEKYGGTLDQLGPKLKQAMTTDAATKLIEDFQTLTRGGADVGSVLVLMKDKIGEVVAQSLQFGTTIPSNLRPLIEELARAGKLVADTNGDGMVEKIENLAGLNWGDPVTTEADKITSAIEELIAKLDEVVDRILHLDDATKPAADDFYRQWDRAPWEDWPAPKVPSDEGPERYPGFAGGTHGQFLDFGAGTPVILHGRERVMTQNEGGGSGGDAVLELRALRRDLSALPTILRDALLTAVR